MSDDTRLVDILHTIGCTKEHATEMQELLGARDPRKCYYYLERCLAAEDAQPDHKIWEEEALELCKSLGTSSSDTIRVVTLVLELRRKLEDFLSRYPTGLTLVRQLLLDVLD